MANERSLLEQEINREFKGAKLVLSSSNADVYFAPEDEVNYKGFLAAIKNVSGSPVLARIAYTGEVTDIWSFQNSEKKQVMHSDLGYHNFIDRQFAGNFGNFENPENALEQIVGLIGSEIKEARERPALLRGDFDDLFTFLPFEGMKTRYGLIADQDADYEIVPNRAHTTAIGRIMTGCLKSCNYCSLGKVPLKLLNLGDFDSGMSSLAAGYREILGKNLGRVDTFFGNGADAAYTIEWANPKGVSPFCLSSEPVKLVKLTHKGQQKGEHDLIGQYGDEHLSFLKVIETVKEYLPHIKKFEFFVGSDTILRVSYGKNADFLERLYKACLSMDAEVDFWVGLESALYDASKLVNKNIKYEDKIAAQRIIRDAGFGYKGIFQADLMGRGFYPSRVKGEGRFIGWEEVVAKNIEFVNEIANDKSLDGKKVPHIYLSVFTPDKNLPIMKLREQGIIVGYENQKEGLEREINTFVEGIGPSIKSGKIKFTNGYNQILHQSMSHEGHNPQFANWA